MRARALPFGAVVAWWTGRASRRLCPPFSHHTQGRVCDLGSTPTVSEQRGRWRRIGKASRGSLVSGRQMRPYAVLRGEAGVGFERHLLVYWSGFDVLAE